MVHKFLPIRTLFLSLLLMFACTTAALEKKFIGKSLDTVNLPYKALTDANHHTWIYKIMVIDYDYSTDRVGRTITFDGELRFTQDRYDTKFRSETVLLNIERCEFRVVFADRSKKIVAVEVFNTYPGTNIYDPAPFKKTLSYDDSYSYVVFGCYLYGRGN